MPQHTVHPMELLAVAAQYSALLFIGILAGLVVLGCLTGVIPLNGLLRIKGGRADGGFSPARVQVLVSTIAAALTFVTQSLSSEPGKLPDVPTGMLVSLGGSHGLYLATKLYAAFFSKPPRVEGRHL